MVSLMDKYIGRILDRLDALGLADNTLVVFTTDHGHFLGQHGLIAKGPFHYEDLHPRAADRALAGTGAGGKDVRRAQSLVDLAPTFLSAAGVGVPRAMTGVDQTAAWRGGAPAREWCIVENRHEPTTIHVKTRVDGATRSPSTRARLRRAVRPESDPGEVNNLWDDPRTPASSTSW